MSARAAILSTVMVMSGATTAAYAQAPSMASEADHSVVYELGWASSWSHQEGWQTKGLTFAIEKTPIENVLELEAGVTVLRSQGTTETSIDLLFKKPWTLSRHAEFMAGIGPEVGHGSNGTFWGLSAVADFMFWPRKNLGWYLEPGYEADFVRGETRRGFAMAVGLIIGR